MKMSDRGKGLIFVALVTFLLWWFIFSLFSCTQAQEQTWIPISTPPVKHEPYLIWVVKYRPDGTTVEHSDVGIYWFDGFQVDHYYEPYSRFVNATVTHWLPIPEKPEVKHLPRYNHHPKKYPQFECEKL